MKVSNIIEGRSRFIPLASSARIVTYFRYELYKAKTNMEEFCFQYACSHAHILHCHATQKYPTKINLKSLCYGWNNLLTYYFRFELKYEPAECCSLLLSSVSDSDTSCVVGRPCISRKIEVGTTTNNASSRHSQKMHQSVENEYKWSSNCVKLRIYRSLARFETMASAMSRSLSWLARTR